MGDFLPCGHDRRFHLMLAKNGCCACELESKAAEIKRLRAVVGKLPKTADGVPVVPGVDRVFWMGCHPENAGVPLEVADDGYVRFRGNKFQGFVDGALVMVGDCYSTREAAEAAGRRES